MTRVVLIRHAEPHAAAHGRCYGSLDVGLSTHGLEQAEALATRLAHQQLVAVYASPLRRALATAAPLAAAHNLAIEPVEALREIDFGAFEGLTYDEIAAEYPSEYRRWMETPTAVHFPGGESYDLLRTRVVASVDELRARHEKAAFAVVTHGGVVRALLATFLEVPAAAFFRIDQSYCGVTIVDWCDEVPLIRQMNSPFV